MMHYSLPKKCCLTLRSKRKGPNSKTRREKQKNQESNTTQLNRCLKIAQKQANHPVQNQKMTKERHILLYELCQSCLVEENLLINFVE